MHERRLHRHFHAAAHSLGTRLLTPIICRMNWERVHDLCVVCLEFVPDHDESDAKMWSRVAELSGVPTSTCSSSHCTTCSRACYRLSRLCTRASLTSLSSSTATGPKTHSSIWR